VTEALAVPAEPGAAPAEPRLSAEEFLELLMPLAAYLFRTGFLLVFFEQANNVRTKLDRDQAGLGTPFDITSALRGTRTPDQARRVSADPGASWITLLLPGAALSFGLIAGMVRNVRDAAWSAVVRSTWWTLRSAGVLLATIVITFFSGDTWKILGTGPAWRVLTLDIGFVVAGIVLVARGRRWWVDLEGLAADDDDPPPQPTPGPLPTALLQPLWELGIAGKASIGWRCLPVAEKVGLWVLYILNIVMYIAFGAVWMALALLVVGTLRIGEATTVALAGGAHVYSWSAHLPGGMVLTEQLLLVAVALGSLAALYAAVALQDAASRKSFLAQALGGLQVSFAVYAVFAEAWARVDELVRPNGAGVASPAAASDNARRGSQA
jgi:hypothetical protein